jgi:hypothetical protein
MKKILICFLVTVISLANTVVYEKNQNDVFAEFKQLLFGTWTLSTDKRFTISIQKDSITYCYGKKYGKKNIHKNPISFKLHDSLFSYKLKNDAYDFMQDDGNIAPVAQIIEYDLLEQDTLIHTIVYIDKSGMDLMVGIRTYGLEKNK